MWRVNPPGLRAPFRMRMGVTALRFESAALLARMLEDAPPARQRALKACGGHQAARLDTSVFRWPRPSRLKGPP